MKKHHSNKIKSINYLPLLSYITFYKTFFTWYRFLSKTASWDRKKIDTYQSLTLQSLIHHAYQNVPYYYSLFKKYNIKPTDIKNPKDISKIPLLTKEIIRRHTTQIKARNYPKNAFFPYHTGGTTGKPLSFFIEKARWLGIHFAFNKTYMHSVGYRSIDKVVSFTGISQPINYHPFYRTIELSSFHTTTKDFDYYLQQIQRFKPKYITTFPSTLLLFTYDMIQRKKPIPNTIKAIFCHGEILLPSQRSYLEDIYQCRVYDQYGHREQCVFATTCSSSDLYHVYPLYGLVELLDEQDHPILNKNNIGEIVATSLLNRIFPFIRYKTGDKAESTKLVCDCGNHNYFLQKIIGRKQEFIIGKNHNKIPLTGLYHLFSTQGKYIRECQIIQEKEGELIISYVPAYKYNDIDLKKINHVFNEILGKQFNYIFQPVESIQRTTHGKQRYLIQKLKIDSY